MPRTRGTLPITISLILSISLVVTPVFGSPSLGSGTIVSAEGAHLGTVAVSVGATVFPGDKLGTEQTGSLQVRSGAARLVLRESSRVTWGSDGPSPSATLTAGTAAFSTASANAFVLHASTATFKPQGDEPTVANVTFLNPKELVVRCSRGAVLIAVEDDVRVVAEGMAYHVVLDPEALPLPGATPAPATRSAWGQNQQPIKAGKSKFIWYAIAFTALVTGFALWKAWESPDRP